MPDTRGGGDSRADQDIASVDEALHALECNAASAARLDSAEDLLAALTAAVCNVRDDIDALTSENEQLRSALDTRDIISQAKGMLMERFDVDAVRAFALLVDVSQKTNTRLVEIARKVVEIDHPSS